MFSKVLIANRGEIACRAIRTLKKMGIASVAVYADPDSNAQHVRDADIAIALGGEAARDSYLNVDKSSRPRKRAGRRPFSPATAFCRSARSSRRRARPRVLCLSGRPRSRLPISGSNTAPERLPPRRACR